MMTPADRFMTVADATIRVREEGPDSAPVIVLLHGFTLSLESWDGWAEALRATHRVIRYDLLGHGLTGPDAQRRYSPTDRATFHAAVMDALGIDRASLAGNSLGGLIAWHYAADHPARVDKLILISPGAYPFNGVTDSPAPIPPPLEAYLRLPTEPAVQFNLSLLYGDASKVAPERIAVTHHMLTRQGNGDAAIAHLEAFVLPDPTARLGQVEAPTRVQWGTLDPLIPVAHGDRIVAAMPNASLARFDGAGHIPHEEIPTETVADAIAFLAHQG